MKSWITIWLLCVSGFSLKGQTQLEKIEKELNSLRYSELIQSMTQRSILIPNYFSDLKGLVARQAYNFWKLNESEKLVSHLNVYKALHDANKYLNYDSIHDRYYHELLGHSFSVTSILFGTDNEFYSAGSDGRVLRWNFASLNEPPAIVYEGNVPIRSIDLSAGSEFLMIVTRDKGLRFIDLLSSEIDGLNAIGQDDEVAQAASFVPGENKYVLINKEGQVKIKGFNGNKTVGETSEKVSSIKVHPTSKTIYAGTESGNLISWDTVRSITREIEESFPVNAIAISSDQKVMALGREKGDVILWDIEQDQLLRIISGHQSAITDLDFSPDDKLLLTASRDRTARVWDIRNPRKLPIVLDDHGDWVMSARFSQNGDYILTGSKDNLIRKWPVNPDILAARICQYIKRQLTTDEWKNYAGEKPYERTCPN